MPAQAPGVLHHLSSGLPARPSETQTDPACLPLGEGERLMTNSRSYAFGSLTRYPPCVLLSKSVAKTAMHCELIQRKRELHLKLVSDFAVAPAVTWDEHASRRACPCSAVGSEDKARSGRHSQMPCDLFMKPERVVKPAQS